MADSPDLGGLKLGDDGLHRLGSSHSDHILSHDHNYGWEFVIVKSNLSSTGDCIIIHSNNVAIDMNGKTLTGNGTGNGITDGGVFVQSVAISNGTIKNFGEGIHFFGSDSDLITLERINALDNSAHGIFILGCCNNLTKIKVNRNGGPGVRISGCCNGIDDVVANNNGNVGVVTLACCSTVTDVTAKNNGDIGVDAEGCCSTATNITSTGNQGDGIYMSGCCNGLTNAQANNNTGAGVDIINDDNQVADSVAKGNGAERNGVQRRYQRGKQLQG